MSLFVRHTAYSERQLNEICWAVIPQEVESIKTPTKPGRLSSHFGTTCTTWKFHLLNGIMIKLYFSCFHRVFLCFPGIFHSVFLCSTVFLCFPGISRSLFTFAYLFPAFSGRTMRHWSWRTAWTLAAGTWPRELGWEAPGLGLACVTKIRLAGWWFGTFIFPVINWW